MKDFQQEESIDYTETFASVRNLMSYKAIFAIAAAKNRQIDQMNVKTHFLYGLIKKKG